MIGKTISHYKVLEQIGGGGMGVVYRAEDTSLQRQVALKFLPPDIVNDRQAVERFKREARAASALNHPNICTIHEIGEHEGQPFIVMELMKGQTLKEKLLRGPLKTDQVLELGIQLADALDAAHSEGIVHRDIKPANLFVTERGQAKILDFGLAKAARKKVESGADTETGTDPDLDLTKAGSTVGTVSYMSPEQALGEKVDARTDLFSLGVVLYEAVTGRQPFTGATSAAVFDQILHLAPTAPIQLNPDAPLALEQVINKALEKDPDLRCQTAAELRTDLKRLLRDTDSSRTVTASAARIPAVKQPRSVAKPALAVVGLLALIASAYALLPRPGEEALPRFSDLDPTFTKLTSARGQEIFPTLSPDGGTVVYQMETSPGNWDIYSMRVGGQNQTGLTDSPEDDTTPRFSPDGDFIAFRSERDGGGIFVMGATGESPLQVTTFGFNPTWSPDGQELAFATVPVAGPVGNAGASGELWKVTVATGRTEQIPSEGTAAQPDWSHGHRLAYWRIRGSQRDIWTIPAEGGEPVPVTADPAVDWNPMWSPDGHYLYFTSDRSGLTGLWRVRIAEETGQVLGDPEAVTTGGGEPTFVTEESGQFTRPDVSPNGQSVVFVSEGVQRDVFIVGSDGSNLRRITNDGYRDFRPRWSPDGDRIAFHTNRAGSHDIWTVNPDGWGPPAVDLRAVQCNSSNMVSYRSGDRLRPGRSSQFHCRYRGILARTIKRRLATPIGGQF